MRPVRQCRCCVPGCRQTVRLVPFVTLVSAIDLTEGLCRRHLAMVDRERRQLLRAARLELRLSPHLAEAALFVRAWQAVRMQAVERAGWRAVA